MQLPSADLLSSQQDEDVLQVGDTALALDVEVAVAAEDRDRGAGAARAPAARARDVLDLGQPRRRAVDLDGLAAGVGADQVARRADGNRLAVRHDRDRVAEALGLL